MTERIGIPAAGVNSNSPVTEMTASFFSVMELISSLLRYLFSVGKEFERRRIQTVSLAGGRRPVRKYMSLMSTTSSAANLDSTHSVAVVGDLGKMIFIE